MDVGMDFREKDEEQYRQTDRDRNKEGIWNEINGRKDRKMMMGIFLPIDLSPLELHVLYVLFPWNHSFHPFFLLIGVF